MIEVGAVPVRIGDIVVGAGGDEKLFVPGGRCVSGIVEVVMVEGKAALQAAGDPGISPLPGSPLRERPHGRQIVTITELFEKQVGEWRGGFSDDDAGVCSLLDHDDGEAEAARDHGEEGAGESGADNGQVVVGGQFFSPQVAHTTLLRICCRRFISRRRTTRAGKQRGQSAPGFRSQRSAKTRPRCRLIP